jgi:putative ATPase
MLEKGQLYSMIFWGPPGSLMPHILNAPTGLMEKEGYGKGYIYDHDMPEGFSGQDYFPEEVGRKTFYNPVERGFERDIQMGLDKV